MTGDGVTGSPATSPVTRSASWMRRLVLIAVGLGLVLMHHLVGAHQHAPSEPVPAGPPGVEVSAMAGHGPGSAPETAAAALHVHHEDRGHDMAAMLHDCLAVLAAAALALVLWLLRGGVPLVHGSRAGAATVRPGRSRPPAPVPVLLAQLQVLRL